MLTLLFLLLGFGGKVTWELRWLEHVYNRPYEGPDFIDMPMKYIFSCKEDAYTYEELIEALHKYDPSKEQDVLRQEDALGG